MNLKSLSRMTVSSLIALSLWGQTAFASLNQTLSPIPAHAPLSVTLSLNPGDWSYVLQKLSQVDENNELSRLIQDFDNQFKSFDFFWDGLTNLGSHVSIAFVPHPQHTGHLLISLNMKDPQRLMPFLDQLQDEFQANGDSHSLVTDKIGPYTSYRLALDTNNTLNQEFTQLDLLAAGNNLLMSFGPNQDLLRDMLYIQEVLPTNSRFKLQNQASFETVETHLKGQPLWLYWNQKNGKQLLEKFGIDGFDQELRDINALKDLLEPEAVDTFVQEINALYSGIGFGLEIESTGLKFKGVSSHASQDMSWYQQEYFAQLSQMQRPDLQNLLKQMPKQPILLLGGRFLGQSWDRSLPFDLSFLTKNTELQAALPKLKQVFYEFSQLDLEQDIVTHLDGRYGLSVEKGPGSPGDEYEFPQIVFYLGLKPGHLTSFESSLQKMKLDFKALKSLDGLEKPEILAIQDPAKSDLLQLQPLEYYHGHQLYQVGELPDLDGQSLVMSRSGDLWLTGLGAEALKAALDQAGQIPATLQNKSLYQPEADYHFFLDFSIVMLGVKSFMQASTPAIGDPDQLNTSKSKNEDWLESLMAIKHIYISSRQLENATVGQLGIKIDMDQIDWKMIVQWLAEDK